MTALGDLLAAKGVDQTGILLRKANAISDDGTVIVGEASTANGTEAFMAVYDESVPAPAASTSTASTPDASTPAAGIVLINDFSASAASVSNTSRVSGASGQTLNRGLLFMGLNNRQNNAGPTVSTQGRARSMGLSYTGFVFGNGSRMLDTSTATQKTGSGGAGLIARADRIGLSLGLGALAANQQTTTSGLGSTSTINARGAGLFVAYAPAPTGIELIFSASRLNVGANIARNYLNGATTETSTGTTSGTYTGVQGRVGYAFQAGNKVTLTPFAAVSNHVTKLNGYTETGGTFAGTVTAQNSTMRKGRIGLDARFRLRPDLELISGLSIERVSETGTFSTVSVTGLGGARFGGGSGARTYNAADVSVGVNYQVSSATTLYSTLNLTRGFNTAAKDIASANLSIGLSVRF